MPEPRSESPSPEDILRAMLRISPEDAAKVRKAATEAMRGADDHDEQDDHDE